MGPRDEQPPLDEETQRRPDVCAGTLEGVLQHLVGDGLPQHRRHVQCEPRVVRQLVDRPEECMPQRLGGGGSDLVVGSQLERHEGVAVTQLHDLVVLLSGQPDV